MHCNQQLFFFFRSLHLTTTILQSVLCIEKQDGYFCVSALKIIHILAHFLLEMEKCVQQLSCLTKLRVCSE